MKKFVSILFAITVISLSLRAQSNDDNIQPPTLGIHFTLTDFNSAAAIRNTSLSSAFKDREFGKIKQMSAGFALNYLNGINKYFDFSATLGGCFLQYPFRDEQTYVDNDHFLLEATASIRGKMTPNNYWFNPYLQAGIGASTYYGYYGAFIPFGAGMQVNLMDETFLLLNMQYRVPVTQTVNYHFLFSIGLAAKIGENK